MTRVTVTADGSGVTLTPDWMLVDEVVLAVICGIADWPDTVVEIRDLTNVSDSAPWETSESVIARRRRDALLHSLVDELRLDTSIRLARTDGNCLVADLLRALAPRIAGTGGADAEHKNGRTA